MTVSSTIDRITYLADGATIDWGFPFAVSSASDIQVFLTDPTGLTTFLDPSSFTVTLFGLELPNPTQEGGFVEFPPGGPPLAGGSASITILRVLPVTQNTSLANQSTLYQSVIEAALDYITMLTQQLTAGVNRCISVALSDPPPAPLPPSLQRANMAAFFDAQGNLTAGAPTSDGGGGSVPISSAMIPVVTAADLPTAQAAMGLGDICTKNIGAGLIDDGFGNLTVNFPIVNITTNQIPNASFYNNVHVVTANIGYGLDFAANYFNGFGFFIDVLTGGKANLAPQPGDKIQGLATGKVWPLIPGTYVYVQTDGVNTWYLRYFRSPIQTVTTIPTGDTNSVGPDTSGTYLIKPGCTRIKCYMVGAGGGGGTNGGSGFTNGGDGDPTTFGAWTANGGKGGKSGNGIVSGVGGAGGAGGTDGTGASTRIIRAAGGSGGNGQQASTAAISANSQSGYGGASYFGGGTTGVSGAATATPPPIPGIGGSGAGNNIGNLGTGGGGGAGEYVEFTMNVFNVNSVAFAVGGSGNGLGGAAPGFRGVLIIEEYYDHGPSQGP